MTPQILSNKKEIDEDKKTSLVIKPRIITKPVTSVNLSSFIDVVYYQGNLSSCSANASSYAYRFLENKQNETNSVKIMPSRLFIYYNTRVLGGNVSSDTGGSITNAISTLKTKGSCDESLWTYDVTKVFVAPPSSCYTSALNHKVITSATITLPTNTTENSVIAPLRSILINGFPFIMRMKVYQSIFTPTVPIAGVIAFPIASGDVFLGYHYIICIGFDDTKRRFTLRNSWGQGNGDNGDYYIPYSYVANGYTAKTTGILCDQFTVITKVSDT